MEITGNRSELETTEARFVLMTVWRNAQRMNDARLWGNIVLYLIGAQDMVIREGELYDELNLLKRIARGYEAEVLSNGR